MRGHAASTDSARIFSAHRIAHRCHLRICRPSAHPHRPHSCRSAPITPCYILSPSAHRPPVSYGPPPAQFPPVYCAPLHADTAPQFPPHTTRTVISRIPPSHYFTRGGHKCHRRSGIFAHRIFFTGSCHLRSHHRPRTAHHCTVPPAFRAPIPSNTLLPAHLLSTYYITVPPQPAISPYYAPAPAAFRRLYIRPCRRTAQFKPPIPEKIRVPPMYAGATTDVFAQCRPHI